MRDAPIRYHHGDLPGTLVRTAIAMLDADGDVDLSLRAVAREAGVSTAAPYRHFADRAALLSAIAAEGYRALMGELAGRHGEPEGVDDLADLACTYVGFAREHPGLFRVMFSERAGRRGDDRREAADAIHAYLGRAVDRILVTDDPAATASGLWASVHGLAVLAVDEKLHVDSAEETPAHVRRVVLATLSARPR